MQVRPRDRREHGCHCSYCCPEREGPAYAIAVILALLTYPLYLVFLLWVINSLLEIW